MHGSAPCLPVCTALCGVRSKSEEGLLHVCGSMLTVLAQGLFCGVLQVIVQKLSERESFKAGILQFADQIMEVLLQVIRFFATRCSCVLCTLDALRMQ